jgi:hypothetical protein
MSRPCPTAATSAPPTRTEPRRVGWRVAITITRSSCATEISPWPPAEMPTKASVAGSTIERLTRCCSPVTGWIGGRRLRGEGSDLAPAASSSNVQKHQSNRCRMAGNQGTIYT